MAIKNFKYLAANNKVFWSLVFQKEIVENQERRHLNGLLKKKLVSRFGKFVRSFVDVYESDVIA